MERHGAGVNAQDVQSLDFVRRPDLNLAVEPSRPPQRRVEGVGAIRGGHHEDACALSKPVHEREQLCHHPGLC
jgi:hypothetical protein